VIHGQEFNQISGPASHRRVAGTRAENDEQLPQSWPDSLNSPHARRKFETTARRFLAELPMGLRPAAVEDVRDALAKFAHGVSDATARQ
jgi:hypothetical protein